MSYDELYNVLEYINEEGDELIKRDTIKYKDGSTKTYIRVTEGYRPAPGKPTKHRTLKSFGYLEDQADQEAFMREVEAYDADPGNRKYPVRCTSLPDTCSHSCICGSDRCTSCSN